MKTKESTQHMKINYQNSENSECRQSGSSKIQIDIGQFLKLQFRVGKIP
jgi:hypothetical protein